ncbi:hypothetical protein [Streptomyces sp. NPDC047000]|uniref:hypothetical protein n=1 Tax=Streptomyces sp. NPDC047000 TaxID=3155474 RepID=UPI0033D5BADD
MKDDNAKRRTRTVRHLLPWIRQQGRDVPGEFLRGIAYKLGSGAVTLIILWWQTHH